jgi:hypothetical protein
VSNLSAALTLETYERAANFAGTGMERRNGGQRSLCIERDCSCHADLALHETDRKNLISASPVILWRATPQ